MPSEGRNKPTQHKVQVGKAKQYGRIVRAVDMEARGYAANHALPPYGACAYTQGVISEHHGPTPCRTTSDLLGISRGLHALTCRAADMPTPAPARPPTPTHCTPFLAISQPSASPIESSLGRQLPYFHRWFTPVSRMRHERCTSAFTAAISSPLVQAASGSARRENTTTPGMRMSEGRSCSPTVARLKEPPKISAWGCARARGYA